MCFRHPECLNILCLPQNFLETSAAYSLCFQFSGLGFTCESLHDARVPRLPRFADPEKRFSLFPPVGHTTDLEIQRFRDIPSTPIQRGLQFVGSLEASGAQGWLTQRIWCAAAALSKLHVERAFVGGICFQCIWVRCFLIVTLQFGSYKVSGHVGNVRVLAPVLSQMAHLPSQVSCPKLAVSSNTWLWFLVSWFPRHVRLDSVTANSQRVRFQSFASKKDELRCLRWALPRLYISQFHHFTISHGLDEMQRHRSDNVAFPSAGCSWKPSECKGGTVRENQQSWKTRNKEFQY